MDRPAVRDGALLIFRAFLGIILVAHGWQKLVIVGPEEAARQFSTWGVPQPTISVWISAIVELVGGAMMVLGFLTSLAAGVVALLLAAAIYFVHFNQGLEPTGSILTLGTIEFPLLLLLSLGIIIVFGPGRASVDGVLTSD